MKFKKFRMSPLNEALLQTPVEAFNDDELDMVDTLPFADAKSIEDDMKGQESLDDSMEDFGEAMRDFIDDSMRREINIKPTGEMKRMKLSESLFEDVKVVSPAVDEEELIVEPTETSTQQLTESPETVVEPKAKKRPRAENEKKWIGDYSSEDLWYAVYDELSATTDNEGSGQQVDKQIKARRGERYEHVYPHGDNDIIIYATKPEEFDFAKRVCDHYGVTYDEPKMDTNKNTNGFYKYSMVIHIPEEGLYQGE